jgi:hypothetical protein
MRSVRGVVLAGSLAAVSGCGSDDSPGASGGPTGNAGTSGAGTAGTGGSGMGGTAGGAGVSGPADSSSASIASFLAAKTYRSAPWQSETAMPRPGGTLSGSPHERVRVYYNEVLVQSFQAGNGSREPPLPHTTGSMAVKEMYDDTDLQVGVAAELRLSGAFEQWAYYCEGPAGRCATGKPTATAAAPLYGVGLGVDCGFCHGGVVFTRPPN